MAQHSTNQNAQFDCVLVSRVTGEVPPSTDLGGYLVNQDLPFFRELQQSNFAEKCRLVEIELPARILAVKPTLREILAKSHISAIAIAVLLLWSLNSAFLPLWGPSFRVAEYLITAIAIRDIPFAGPFAFADRVMLFVLIQSLFSAFVSFAAAWLLARWVYGEGPVRSLSKYKTRISGRSDA
jgi:hypothetical protein